MVADGSGAASLQRKLNFDFNRVNVKLGPWKFGFNIKAGQLGTK